MPKASAIKVANITLDKRRALMGGVRELSRYLRTLHRRNQHLTPSGLLEFRKTILKGFRDQDREGFRAVDDPITAELLWHYKKRTIPRSMSEGIDQTLAALIDVKQSEEFYERETKDLDKQFRRALQRASDVEYEDPIALRMLEIHNRSTITDISDSSLAQAFVDNRPQDANIKFKIEPGTPARRGELSRDDRDVYTELLDELLYEESRGRHSLIPRVTKVKKDGSILVDYERSDDDGGYPGW